jgi:unsaturated rhamnogalacturonyl hydrolase
VNITIQQDTNKDEQEVGAISSAADTKETLWSIKMADSVMASKELLNKAWHYETGVMLKAFSQIWQKTKEQKYYDYIKANIDHWVNDDGSINTYNQDEFRLDDVTPGRVLLFLYQETKNEKYLKAANNLREHLRRQPRTDEGGFWHKQIYAYQMWLDGIFMGCPFYAEYGQMFNEPANFDDVVKQIILIASHTKDEGTGLYRHGWFDMNRKDRSVKEPVWVDPKTGKAPCIWGRAVGWYTVALVEVLDYLPENHPQRGQVIAILKNLITALISAQDAATGLWYQVMDKPNGPGNYLESSASCMFVYAIAKAVRKGFVDDVYLNAIKKAYQGILQQFITVDDKGHIQLTDTCQMASLGPGSDGSYEYYIRQPRVVNDNKGVGPFLMASIEMEMAEFE